MLGVITLPTGGDVSIQKTTRSGGLGGPEYPAGAVYTDPETGNSYIYLQTDTALATPGLIVRSGLSGLGDGVLLDATNDTASTTAYPATLKDAAAFTTAIFEDTDVYKHSDGSRNENGHQVRGQINGGTLVGENFVVTEYVSSSILNVYVTCTTTAFADGNWSASTSTDTDYVLKTDTYCTPITAATHHGFAASIQAMAADEWGWFGYVGHFYLMLDASDNAITTDDLYIMPATTDTGKVMGATGTYAIADEPNILGKFEGLDISADGLVLAQFNGWRVKRPGRIAVPARERDTYTVMPKRRRR